jgi:hypothetical protein
MLGNPNHQRFGWFSRETSFGNGIINKQCFWMEEICVNMLVMTKEDDTHPTVIYL